MNALVIRTSVTKCPPTAKISKEDTSAPARKATNTYKAMISIVNVSAMYLSYFSTVQK